MKEFFNRKNITALIAIPVSIPLISLLFFTYLRLLSNVTDKLAPQLNFNNTMFLAGISIFNVLLMALFGWLIFRSKLKDLSKIVFSIFASMVVFTSLIFEQALLVSYGLYLLVFAAVIYYFYRSKKPWTYYYAVSWTAFIILFLIILNRNA
ncbi:MAG: hypothetical protein ACYCYI_03045 [Saccharofermentanales bacterium]